jgi:hypothetical protein
MTDSLSANAGLVRRGLWPTGTTQHHEIVAAAQPGEARSHITAALRDVAKVRFTLSLAETAPGRRDETPLLGLLYLDGHTEQTGTDHWVAGVKQFRAQWPPVPVVVYIVGNPKAMHRESMTSRFGARTIWLEFWRQCSSVGPPSLSSATSSAKSFASVGRSPTMLYTSCDTASTTSAIS